MRRFWLVLVLILALCAAVFLTVSMPFASEGPVAEAGLLDVSGADLAGDVYELSGEWELYYGRFYTPADFAAGAPAGGELLSLPSSWAALGHPEHGYATYRLTLRTGQDEPLSLFLPEIISASRVWANGQEVFRSGHVGDSAERSVPGIRNELVTVFPEDGTVDLVVQASNYHMVGSGLYYPILLGRNTVLAHRIFFQRTAAAAALGGILLIGVYHLFLYGFRRREKLYLTFSLICLTTVLRMAVETNGLVQYFLPGGMNLAVGRAFLLLFLLHGFCVSLMMLQVFSIRLRGAVRAVYWACLLLPMAGVLALPYSLAVVCIFLVFPAHIIAVVLAVRSAKIGRDPYYLLYLCAMILFLFCATVTKTVLEGVYFIPALVPNLFLILSQCVMLSRDYAGAMVRVEQVNADLEGLVERRTGELRQVNLRLSASQAALREMITNISHDLKTPLTVLNNYLELLGDESLPLDDRERSEYLGIAYHKNLDLQRLIHNLFEVTRMEGGTAAYTPEWVPARALVEQAARKYADQVRDQGLTFSARACGDFVLHVDLNKIWSVLDNLVYNALRHTPPGGSISLTLERAGNRAALRVADTGVGIPPEHLPHIFERFYKVSQERGERDGSSGLGLYIVKTVAEAMGGSAAVESTVGTGTIFTIFLPAGP